MKTKLLLALSIFVLLADPSMAWNTEKVNYTDVDSLNLDLTNQQLIILSVEHKISGSGELEETYWSYSGNNWIHVEVNYTTNLIGFYSYKAHVTTSDGQSKWFNSTDPLSGWSGLFGSQVYFNVYVTIPSLDDNKTLRGLVGVKKAYNTLNDPDLLRVDWVVNDPIVRMELTSTHKIDELNVEVTTYQDYYQSVNDLINDWRGSLLWKYSELLDDFIVNSYPLFMNLIYYFVLVTVNYGLLFFGVMEIVYLAYAATTSNDIFVFWRRVINFHKELFMILITLYEMLIKTIVSVICGIVTAASKLGAAILSLLRFL